MAATVMVGGTSWFTWSSFAGIWPAPRCVRWRRRPAPTTACQLLKRFRTGQCRAVVAAIAELGNRFDRQVGVSVSAPVTLDMDGTLSEVYGRHKEMASFNHEGWRGFLSVFVSWDERRLILVADLLKGSAWRSRRGQPAPASPPGATHRPRSGVAVGRLPAFHAIDAAASGRLPPWSADCS